MKKIYLPLVFVLLLSATQSAKAQNDLDLLVNDLLLVAENFASPGAEGAALQSSAGWFTSGSTLDKWKFEVSLHANALFVPSAKKNQLTSNRDFGILRFQGSENFLLPTVYGGETDAVFEFDFRNPFNNRTETVQFDAIDGLDRGMLLHPYPQVTVGLPYSTEVALRFLPTIIVNDVGISTYGIGFKHNLTQYFERRYNAEDFQFAVVATYSNFKVDYAFTQLDIPLVLALNRIDVNADLLFFQVLGSKLYENFEVYGGLGVTSSQFDYEMGGSGSGLTLLNQALEGLGGRGTKFKGDVGFNYYYNNFKFSTMLTASNFFNANIGVHYRIN